MVSNLDEQTFQSEFESHWVPNSYSLGPHLTKKLSKVPRSPPGLRLSKIFEDTHPRNHSRVIIASQARK